MTRITLTDAQILDLAQELRGTKDHPSRQYQRALLGAGILPEGGSLDLVEEDSIKRLDLSLVRCAGCETYQPAHEMSQSGGNSFCPACVTGLLYRHSSGG